MFEELIKEKTNEELIQILSRSQDYQPEFIELVKKELTENRNISLHSLQQEQQAYEKKYYASKEKIHGWLTFFLVFLGIGGILTPMIGFAYMSISDYETDMGLLWAQIGAVCDSILFLGFAFLAVYTIISFYNYSPNAVGLGKAYLILAIITNLLALLGGDYASSGFSSLPQIIGRVFWQIIWFFYLSHSEQVKSLFPKEEQKLLKRDKILLFSIVAPAVIWLISIFVFSFSQGFVEQTQLNYPNNNT